MQSISRGLGLFGVVLLFGGVTSSLAMSAASRSTRDLAIGFAAVGYALIGFRCFVLALSAPTLRTRLISGAVLLCLVIGPIAFVGIALTLSSPGGPGSA